MTLRSLGLSQVFRGRHRYLHLYFGVGFLDPSLVTGMKNLMEQPREAWAGQIPE